jgi:hypothetical protein
MVFKFKHMLIQLMSVIILGSKLFLQFQLNTLMEVDLLQIQMDYKKMLELLIIDQLGP